MKAKYDIKTGNFLVFLDNQVLEYTSTEFEVIYRNFIEELSVSRYLLTKDDNSEQKQLEFKFN